MALFGKKKPSKDDVPVSQVMSMRDQGIDNNRIIQTLQRDGYSSSQIFEALNQADMKPASGPSSGQDNTDQNQPPQQQPQQPSQPQASDQNSGGYQPDYSQSSFKQPEQTPPNVPSYQQRSPQVEELIESIIDEKWNDLVKDINKIVNWKNQMESRINSLEKDFSNLKEDYDKLHQAVIGKVSEYDKHILNVGAEVEAMEKVFSKVLPVFTENVKELSNVADELKKKKKK